MHLLFLIPLMTSLVAGYIFNKSAQEIADLSGSVAVISLILSLVLAPWQFQLLVLILVIISTRKLLRQNEYKMQLKDNKRQQLN
jgi:Ca2+-dependent lipid-binding protein